MEHFWIYFMAYLPLIICVLPLLLFTYGAVVANTEYFDRLSEWWKIKFVSLPSSEEITKNLKKIEKKKQAEEAALKRANELRWRGPALRELDKISKKLRKEGYLNNVFIDRDYIPHLKPIFIEKGWELLPHGQVWNNYYDIRPLPKRTDNLPIPTDDVEINQILGR